MLEPGAERCIDALDRAIGRADLETASRSCRMLKTGLSALDEHELLALKSLLQRCRTQAHALRDAYATELRNAVRGRRNVGAYLSGVHSGVNGGVRNGVA